jgi:hypothetical protein
VRVKELKGLAPSVNPEDVLFNQMKATFLSTRVTMPKPLAPIESLPVKYKSDGPAAIGTATLAFNAEFPSAVMHPRTIPASYPLDVIPWKMGAPILKRDDPLDSFLDRKYCLKCGFRKKDHKGVVGFGSKCTRDYCAKCMRLQKHHVNGRMGPFCEAVGDTIHTKSPHLDWYGEKYIPEKKDTVPIGQRDLFLEATTTCEAPSVHPLWNLTKDEECRVDNAILQNRDGEDIVASIQGGLKVIHRNFLTLQPGRWVNDEIINLYLALVLREHTLLCLQDETKKPSHIFGTTFFTKLFEDDDFNYHLVARWTKRVGDIFEFDKLFFPVNPGESHWACVIVFVQTRKIQYYDSYSQPGKRFIDGVHEYLKEHHLQTRKRELPGEWTKQDGTAIRQLQFNAFDCGLFCCSFVEFLLKDKPLTFTEADMERRRKHIALAILNAGIHQPRKDENKDEDDSDGEIEFWVVGNSRKRQRT